MKSKFKDGVRYYRFLIQLCIMRSSFPILFERIRKEKSEK